MERTELPVAVFDSGLGGISVLRALVQRMPGEDFLYFGDSANAPYGVRPVAEVRELTQSVIARLYARGIKAAVIACNTATSAAIGTLRAAFSPVAVGLLFGVAGVMGLLVGGLSSGFVLAVFMANSGGAWDNAKKLIEEGNFGGKGSECHKATVVGDTVGDPFKDTSGPSLNILIKLMSMVSIVMAGLTVAWHLF